MARNKYPEETVNLILNTAARLFMEKGFDRTSLQDIIDETKLSKGAIYHHFTSKEDIFDKICQRIGAENSERLAAVRDDKSLNGLEKLRQTFRSSMLHPNQERITEIIPCLLDNPRLLAIHVRMQFDDVVPNFIAPIIKEGIADGSIKAENPDQLAEAIMILSDVWLNPAVRPVSKEDTRRRCEVFRSITRSLGLDFFDDDVIQAYVDYSDAVSKNQSNQ
ncbi:MAG: TetR/AcrR family transcriptional regulator [Oscillospiraceae bacterium]|nr:TetR/AcrR family transcriptional regulator [Oscillospiraceae bacterium]